MSTGKPISDPCSQDQEDTASLDQDHAVLSDETDVTSAFREDAEDEFSELEVGDDKDNFQKASVPIIWVQAV